MIILTIILVIIAIPFIAALFMSKDFVIEKEVIVNKPLPEVFAYIRSLKNHSKFSKWILMDPNIRHEYTGTDNTPGFKMSWDSDNKNVGQGSQTIARIDEGKRIDYDLHFIKPFENTAKAYMTTTAAGADKTKVTWAFSGDRSYMNRIMHFVLNLKKMLGKDLQQGLDNLKQVMEK